MPYMYPDPNDSLTISLINKHEPSPGYWAKSERFVLNHVKNLFEKQFLNKNATLLDAGCGDGRLLFEFEKYFKKIIAIEPDQKRLEKAKNAFNSDKADFINTGIETFSYKSKFDAIVCSHVIQHVETDHVSMIRDPQNWLFFPK